MASISCVVVEKWVNVVVVVYICATAGEGTSDVLCQHFDGGQPQASVGERMQVSVLVDVVNLCWGRLTISNYISERRNYEAGLVSCGSVG
jgi:hypothetical protein